MKRFELEDEDELIGLELMHAFKRVRRKFLYKENRMKKKKTKKDLADKRIEAHKTAKELNSEELDDIMRKQMVMMKSLVHATIKHCLDTGESADKIIHSLFKSSISTKAVHFWVKLIVDELLPKAERFELDDGDELIGLELMRIIAEHARGNQIEIIAIVLYLVRQAHVDFLVNNSISEQKDGTIKKEKSVESPDVEESLIWFVVMFTIIAKDKPMDRFKVAMRIGKTIIAATEKGIQEYETKYSKAKVKTETPKAPPQGSRIRK